MSRDPPPDPDRYRVSTDAAVPEFLAAVRVYARAVADHHDLSAAVTDLDWTVSKRAKRRAGAVEHRDRVPQTVSLTWEYFQEHGWTATADVVRHELVHVHLLNEHDDPSHGDRFRALADDLRTTVHCEPFADPNYLVVCDDCGSELPRYRKSALVKRPHDYRCGDCGGRLTAHSTASETD